MIISDDEEPMHRLVLTLAAVFFFFLKRVPPVLYASQDGSLQIIKKQEDVLKITFNMTKHDKQQKRQFTVIH